MKAKNNIFKRFYKHVVIFLMVLLSGHYTLDEIIEQNKNEYLSMQTEILNEKYKTNYNYFKIISKDIYGIYQDNKFVIDLISDANDNIKERDRLRTALYKKLKKRYKRLKNMGVIQLHFHLNNNTSFLRMHNPEKFGDNLTIDKTHTYSSAGSYTVSIFGTFPQIAFGKNSDSDVSTFENDARNLIMSH